VIVLDTNVVSELMRPHPAPGVVAWAVRQPALDLYTTAVTLGEIRYGIGRLPAGRRRQELSSAADGVLARMPDRVLAFDAPAAGHFAEVTVRRERAGRPIEGFDAQIAAICLRHGATLATRNEADFVDTGVAVVNPWRGTA
jgi:toxin FitB